MRQEKDAASQQERRHQSGSMVGQAIAAGTTFAQFHSKGVGTTRATLLRPPLVLRGEDLHDMRPRQEEAAGELLRGVLDRDVEWFGVPGVVPGVA